MFPRRSFLQVSAVTGLLLGTAFSSKAELTSTSPFLPPQGQMVAAPTAPPPFELRGITVVEGTTMFSIYDPSPAKKSGVWVKLNEGGHDFSVKKYDADRDTVTIDYQGRTLELAMRTPKIASSGPAMALPAPQMSPQAMVGVPAVGNNLPPPRPAGNVVPNPTPATEAARMADWTAEIEKRRQMRNQATGMPTPNTAPASAQSTGPQPQVRSAPGQYQTAPSAGAPQRPAPPQRRGQ